MQLPTGAKQAGAGAPLSGEHATARNVGMTATALAAAVMCWVRGARQGRLLTVPLQGMEEVAGRGGGG